MRILIVLLGLLLPVSAFADDPSPAPHRAQFGAGDGPRVEGSTVHVLDAAGTQGQSNAVAYDRPAEGLRGFSLACEMRVLEGGDGGAFVFLNTTEYGSRGPAPFAKSWVEPNLKATFAVGIDVHNPPGKEQFSPWGNYENRPQREVSLHWDGREIVKRVAPEEFRGDWAAVRIDVAYVVGGAEVSIEIADGKVYDRYFLAHMHPYAARLAIGAGTRADTATEFDVRSLSFTPAEREQPRRPPLHVDVFNHVLTNNKKTAYEAEVNLPPANWAFGRVIMTIDIHDAGKDWDEWDRNGEVSIWDDDGVKRGVVPFITSYRTECHWKVDVTHFRPYLTGKTRIEIAAGTTFYKNRGYMMSLSLDYHHGAAQLVPCRVVPLWVGRAKYKSGENHFQDFFEPQTVAIDAETKSATFFCTTTGHSQVGEFTPSKRTLVVGAGDDAARYPNTLWKTDVYLNPNRPQFGTWQYARAGWAPGDVVRPWILDVTANVTPGEDIVFRYEPEPYAFEGRQPSEKQVGEAGHVVRAYLVLYREAKNAVPAPIMLVTNVGAGSNAAQAGMKRGDYLATYEGTQIDSLDDLRAAIQGAAGKAGKVKVVVFRGGERRELELEPGRMGIGLGQR